MSEMKKPTQEQMAKFKKNANDSSLSAEVRAKFQAIVDKFENVTEEVGEDVVKAVEPAKKKGRKPRATSTTKTKPSASDVEKAKAEIKKRTGKTEEECESIIEEYRALRTKAQEGKRKAEQASADNKKRVDKLEDKGDLIEGTNVKTADAVIETTAKDVAEKIEQQIEAVEEKAEKEAKVEVAKDKTIKTPKAKKEAVEKKVDEKVKKETKVVVKRVVVDTSALLTSIAESLGKFDKDSQKEFLIKLRSDIDKLLSKYAFGGLTDGATQTMNITQSNLSASSVNPTMFAKGGGVGEATFTIVVPTIQYKKFESALENSKISRYEVAFHRRGVHFTFFNEKQRDSANEILSKLGIESMAEYEKGEKFKIIKEAKEYAEGGGVDGKITLYKVVGYQNIFDYDEKINGSVIADDYTTKGQAEKTKNYFRTHYRYIDIEEYKGKDPFTKYAEGGEVAEYKVGDNVRYQFNNRIETGEIVRRIDDESVEVRSGFSSALVPDRRIVGFAPKKRFSFFEHGGGVDGNDYSGEYDSLGDFVRSNEGMRKMLSAKYNVPMSEVDENLNGELGYDEEVIKNLLRGKGYSVKFIDNKNDGYFKVTKRKMAQGGMTEHGLRMGDKIVGKGVWTIDVEDSNKKRQIVNLNKGTREKAYKKGGNVSSMLRNRRGM